MSYTEGRDFSRVVHIVHRNEKGGKGVWPNIIVGFLSGMSITELAEKSGYRPPTIYQALNQMGINVRNREKLSEVALRKIEEARARRALEREEAKMRDEAKEEAKEAVKRGTPSPSPDDEELVLITQSVMDAVTEIIDNGDVTNDQKRVVGKGIHAIEKMLDRFIAAECTSTAFTSDGAEVTISASKEIANLTSCMKVLIPLQREIHAITKGDSKPSDEANARMRKTLKDMDDLTKMARAKVKAANG